MKKNIPFPLKITKWQHNKIVKESKAVWLTRWWFVTMLIETYVRTDVIRGDSVTETSVQQKIDIQLKED